MPEGIKLTKFEGNEGAEGPPRYRIVEREVLETYEDGSKRERWLECNGNMHRRSVQIISPGARGEFDFIEELYRDELGPCGGGHQ